MCLFCLNSHSDGVVANCSLQSKEQDIIHRDHLNHLFTHQTNLLLFVSNYDALNTDKPPIIAYQIIICRPFDVLNLYVIVFTPKNAKCDDVFFDCLGATIRSGHCQGDGIVATTWI